MLVLRCLTFTMDPTLLTPMALAPYITPQRLNTVRTALNYARSPAGRANLNTAARLVTSAVRSVAAKKRKASTPAQRAGIGTAKNYASDKKSMQSNGVNVNWNTRNVYSQNLTDINKATGAQEIDGRLRQQINITGFSIDIMLRNRTNGWMLCNFAVVSPRNNNSDPPSIAGFFRDYTTSRDVDFSISLNSNQIHTYPISTDKWRILMHKRVQIAPMDNNGAGGWDIGGSNFIKRKYWVPLKRTIVYNDDTDDSAESKVFLLLWFDSCEKNAGDISTTNALYGGVRTVTYFNEVIEIPKRFRIGA